MIKLLINGLPNTGKTTLLKGLKDAFIVSYDGKPCTLEMAHSDLKDFEDLNDFKTQVNEKIKAYKEKFKKLPETIVFDTISRVEDTIEMNAQKKCSGFEVWNKVSDDVKSLCRYMESLVTKMNVVLVCHITYSEGAGKYIETCKGSFNKIGGFLGTVDYAITCTKVGKKHYVEHKGQMSRTLLSDMPAEQEANDFNLQEYMDKINKQVETSNKWSI